jgi:hypothetical protein
MEPGGFADGLGQNGRCADSFNRLHSRMEANRWRLVRKISEGFKRGASPARSTLCFTN